MIPFLYWTFVVILLLLTILFILAFTVRVKLSPLTMKVTLFHIPILILKEEKLYRKMVKTEQKIEKKPPLNPLYLHLLSYLHIDRICITQSMEGRKDIEAIFYGVQEIMKSYIDEKRFSIRMKKGNANTQVYVRFHFYLGVILGNFLCIRRQIHAKSHS